MKSFLIVFVFLLGGCSVTAPNVTDYRIDPKVSITTNVQKTKSYSLKVVPVFSSATLTTNMMHYRVGNYKEYTFTESAWSDTPNRAIVNKLVDVLDASGLFEGVYSYKSSKRTDMMLEVRLDDFIQFFNETQNVSEVKVSIAFKLLRKKDGKLVSSKKFIKTMQTKTLDAEGGVEALNTLFAQILEETVQWLGKNTK